MNKLKMLSVLIAMVVLFVAILWLKEFHKPTAPAPKGSITNNKTVNPYFLTYTNTYTNKHFGFKFEYPNKYFFDENFTDTGEMWLHLTSDMSSLGPYVQDANCISEYTLRIEKPAVAFDQLEQLFKSEDKHFKDIAFESKVIDGHKALLVRAMAPHSCITRSCGYYPRDKIVFDDGNMHITFGLCIAQTNSREEFDKIISTFEFVK